MADPAPPKFARVAPWLALLAILVAGIAWRIHLAHFPGHRGDVFAFQMWAVGEADWPLKYDQPNYPPIYPSLLRVLRRVHDALDLPGDFREPIGMRSMADSRGVFATIKLLPILADLAIAIAVFLIARRTWMGVVLAALALALPAIWYDSAHWGQTDTLLGLALGLIAWAAATQRPFATGVFIAAALLFKLQSAPAVLVALVAVVAPRVDRTRRIQRLLYGAATVVIAVLLLSAATGNLRQWRAGYDVVGHQPQTTVSSFNLWWLIDRPWDRPVFFRGFPPDDVPRLLGLTARQIGFLAWGAAMAYIIWRVSRPGCVPGAVAGSMAAAVLSMAILATEMHERYAVPFVILSLFAACWDRRWAWLAFAAAWPIWLNCVALLPWIEGAPEAMRAAVNRVSDPNFDALRTAIAVGNVACWIASLVLLWTTPRGAAVTSQNAPPAR